MFICDWIAFYAFIWLKEGGVKIIYKFSIIILLI